jgi:hypothetical protein
MVTIHSESCMKTREGGCLEFQLGTTPRAGGVSSLFFLTFLNWLLCVANEDQIQSVFMLSAEETKTFNDSSGNTKDVFQWTVTLWQEWYITVSFFYHIDTQIVEDYDHQIDYEKCTDGPSSAYFYLHNNILLYSFYKCHVMVFHCTLNCIKLKPA